MSSIMERVERVRRDMRLNAKAFCKHIGFSYQNYSHMTGSRRTRPSVDLISALERSTTVNIPWLLNGEGPPYAGGSPLPPAGSRGSGGRGTRAPMDPYVLIPLYGVEGSAGEGNLVEREEVEDLLAFKRDWIAQELRSTPDNLLLIHVQGESMVPTLNPGDVILLERYHRAQAGDGIYALRMGSALLVKRLQFLPDESLRVSSDNPAYEPFTVNLKEQGPDLAIVGRVVWAGRRF